MPFGLDLQSISVIIIIALTVGAFLFCIACRLRFEIDLHDLRVASHALQQEHKRRIADLQAGGVELGDVNVDILD